MLVLCNCNQHIRLVTEFIDKYHIFQVFMQFLNPIDIKSYDD